MLLVCPIDRFAAAVGVFIKAVKWTYANRTIADLRTGARIYHTNVRGTCRDRTGTMTGPSELKREVLYKIDGE